MLILIGIPLAAWFWVDQTLIAFFGVRLKPWFSRSLYGWIALVILLVFTVLRNFPSDRFGVLRPTVAESSIE